MRAEYVQRWAELLAGYCLDVREREPIMIAGEVAARPLLEACFREVVLRGGDPFLRVDFPGLDEFFLEHASEDQLRRVSLINCGDAIVAAARIRIAAETDLTSKAALDPRKQSLFHRAQEPVRKIARSKRWVLTQYPTAAYAGEAEMPLAEYEEFIARSMFLDRPDPKAAWVALGLRQAGLVEFLKNVSTVRIEGPGTDLTLSVGGRTWINSDGRRNMPSGEVFTGPIEHSANGRLHCSFPVCRDGRRIVGISLEFRDGKVVSASADEGASYLNAMLDLDDGARRLGELGIGLNYGIDRFTGSILYDEKIGGTVHLALGQSYPETGGTNESALHWDLIVDLRTDGRVWADGRAVMENGEWRVGN